MTLYVVLIVLAALGGLLFLSRKDSRQAGKDEERLNELEVESEAMASRPLTAGAIIDRLHKLAANKADNKPDGK